MSKFRLKSFSTSSTFDPDQINKSNYSNLSGDIFPGTGENGIVLFQ